MNRSQLLQTVFGVRDHDGAKQECERCSAMTVSISFERGGSESPIKWNYLRQWGVMRAHVTSFFSLSAMCTRTWSSEHWTLQRTHIIWQQEGCTKVIGKWRKMRFFACILVFHVRWSKPLTSNLRKIFSRISLFTFQCGRSRFYFGLPTIFFTACLTAEAI